MTKSELIHSASEIEDNKWDMKKVKLQIMSCCCKTLLGNSFWCSCGKCKSKASVQKTFDAWIEKKSLKVVLKVQFHFGNMFFQQSVCKQQAKLNRARILCNLSNF